MANPSLAFLGGGNMATSLIGGLISEGMSPHEIIVFDISAEKRCDLQSRFGIQVAESNGAAVDGTKTVVLAVKPQVLKNVCLEVATLVQQQKPLVISIAAGVPSAALNTWFGANIPTVRCMPNTPALIKAGASAMYATDTVSGAQREQAEQLLRAVGTVAWIAEESLMDAVTALSGSGPAYFFYFMEALAQAGIELGLPADIAKQLTLQTALGAASLAQQSNEDLATLRRNVTSPGGTTERALLSMEANKVAEHLRNAVVAANERGQELAKQFGG